MEKINVKWKSGVRFNANPEKVYQEVEIIRKEINSKTQPEDLIEYAKDPNTELHKCFEWDNTKAAFAHRKQQARMVLNGLYITKVKIKDITIEDVKVSECIIKPIEENKVEKYYNPPIESLSREDEAEILIKQVLNDLYPLLEKLKKYILIAKSYNPDIMNSLNSSINNLKNEVNRLLKN